MREITMDEAMKAPGDWRWSAISDFAATELRDAILDAEPGDKLTAWKPMDKPSAEACAQDIEEVIEDWSCDDTAWWALTTFCNGEPDGCQLTDSETFRAGLRSLLASEIAKITVLAYEEAGCFVVVPNAGLQ